MTETEGDCIELFIALTEAVRRLKALEGGQYEDLLVVLERTGSTP